MTGHSTCVIRIRYKHFVLPRIVVRCDEVWRTDVLISSEAFSSTLYRPPVRNRSVRSEKNAQAMISAASGPRVEPLSRRCRSEGGGMSGGSAGLGGAVLVAMGQPEQFARAPCSVLP